MQVQNKTSFEDITTAMVAELASQVPSFLLKDQTIVLDNRLENVDVLDQLYILIPPDFETLTLSEKTEFLLFGLVSALAAKYDPFSNIGTSLDRMKVFSSLINIYQKELGALPSEEARMKSLIQKWQEIWVQALIYRSFPSVRIKNLFEFWLEKIEKGQAKSDKKADIIQL